jgi:predicted aspartyl protease
MGRATQLLIATAFACCAAPLFAAANCKLLQVAAWTVQPPSGSLIVEGAINGQKVGVALDTGMMTSLMPRDAADRLGLTRYDARGYRAFGIGGETHAQYVMLDEFKLGQAARRNWRVLVIGERDIGRDLAFFLGYDFFEQVDVEFDLANKTVRLFQPQDCGELPLAYWARGTADAVKLEMDHEKPAILVPAKLNGKSIIAELDSGAERSLVSGLLAAQLGVTPSTPGTRAAGTIDGVGPGQPDQWIGAFESFTIGGEIIRNPDIVFTDLHVTNGAVTGTRLPGGRELSDMILGLDFLRAHRIYVAHSQRKLYFTYSGGPVFTTAARAAAKPAPKPDI